MKHIINKAFGRGLFLALLAIHCSPFTVKGYNYTWGNAVFQYEYSSDKTEAILTGVINNDFFSGTIDRKFTYANLEIPHQIIVKDDVTNGHYRALRVVIGANFLSGNNSVQNVAFWDGIETINEKAFFGCSNLRTLNFPSSLKTIGSYAFSECPNLSNLNFPDWITIKDHAFKNSGTYTTLDFSRVQLTHLGGYSFEHFGNLICVKLPPIFNTKVADENTSTAFANNNNIESIYLYDPDPHTLIPFHGINSTWCWYVLPVHIAAYREANPSIANRILPMPIPGFFGFHANGGVLPDTVQGMQQIFLGTKVAKTADPTRTNYVFVGWYTDPMAGREWNFDDYILESTTVYAHWNPIITFRFNEDVLPEINEIIVPYGESLEQPETPLRQGYVFVGWYNAFTGSDLFNFPIQNIIEPFTLYAHWLPLPYTLTLNVGTPQAISNVTGGGVKTANSYVTATAEVNIGYTFEGWYNGYNKASAENPYTFRMSTTGDITLEARANPTPYILTLEKGQGIISVIGEGVKNYHSEVTVKAIVSTSLGYTFDGWYNGSERISIDTIYTFEMPSSDYTLTARANPNSYTLTLNNGAGIIAHTGDGNKIYGSNVTISATVGSGYTWGGWYNGAIKVSEDNPYTFPYTLTGPLTLTARAKNSYLLTLSANPTQGFTSLLGESDKIANTTVTVKAILSNRIGYTFTGWYDGNTLKSTDTIYTFIMPGSDYTLTARATALPQAITYNANGGSNAPPNTTVLYNEQFFAYGVPTRTGYDFVGWFDVANGGIKYVFPHTVIQPTTLYAHWEGIPQNITYIGHEGVDVPVNTSIPYGNVLPYNEPTRAGHAFGGWWSAAGGSGIKYTLPLTVTTPLTLHAHWIPISVPIIFNANGGGNAPANTTILYGQSLARPASPLPPIGYTFDEWYNQADGGTRYTFPFIVTEPLFLYAHWKGVPQAITYNANGGILPDGLVATVPYGQALNQPANAAPPTGYIFDGWFNATVGGTRYAFPFIVTAPYVLIARYNKVTPISITYNANEGVLPSSGTYLTSVLSGGHLAEPTPSPTRTGYIFAGWYDWANDGSRYTFPIPNITTSLTLHAQWILAPPSNVPPTKAPNDVPSDASIDTPSDVPSDVPSAVPSDASSDTPSDIPSDASQSFTPSEMPETPQAPQSSTAIDNIGNVDDAAYYDLQGRRVAYPEKGRLYIIIYSTGQRQLIIK